MLKKELIVEVMEKAMALVYGGTFELGVGEGTNGSAYGEGEMLMLRCIEINAHCKDFNNLCYRYLPVTSRK